MLTLRSAAHGTSSGFSLIELMAVTAIFVVLSVVVLVSNSRFGSVIVLQNLAHDIALSTREAQVYGIAVRRFDPSTGPGIFSYGYGMHFAPGATYELFADANTNGKWDAGETVKAVTISGGYTISSLCTGASTCGLSRIDIIFKRPEPDACIGSGGTVTLDAGGHCTSTIQRARVIVQAPRGELVTVVLENSGQISVQ